MRAAPTISSGDFGIEMYTNIRHQWAGIQVNLIKQKTIYIYIRVYKLSIV